MPRRVRDCHSYQSIQCQYHLQERFEFLVTQRRSRKVELGSASGHGVVLVKAVQLHHRLGGIGSNQLIEALLVCLSLSLLCQLSLVVLDVE